MQSVWVHFRGLAPGSAAQDLRTLTGGRAGRIDVQSTSRTEVVGRFEVASMDVALQVLEHANYAVVRGSVVRLCMGPECLAGCTQVVIEGIPFLDDEETRLHDYCRQFGVVCGLRTDRGAARAWLDAEVAARNLVLSVKTVGYYGRRLQAYIEEAGADTVVVEVGSDNELAGPEAAPKTSGTARKSTGKRRRAAGQAAGRQGKVLRTETAHIEHPPAGRSPTPPTPLPQLPPEARGHTGDHAHVRNIMDMTPWRAKAPFIYEFIYRRVPEVAAADSECCLSMAWCGGQQSGTLSCYLSQGNAPAAATVRDWMDAGVTSEDASSAITMTAFDLPARGQATNIMSLLSAFNSSEVSVLHKNQKMDVNSTVITSLKLHDSGRILFGCTMQSVFVWGADALRQRAMLLLMDDIDGVYDVGRAHVVANSSRGDVGVWKAGSQSHMWRYNDTRRFRARASLLDSPPRITALQIASSDDGVYVGDSLGRLSHCDFRAPHIEHLTSDHRGILKCLELAGDTGILAGTYTGQLSLLDTRFMRAGGQAGSQASVVRQYHAPAGASAATINSVRVCPHDSDILACAIGAGVYIHAKEPEQAQSLLFSHEAHQTQVTDFCWHPDRDYMYTIGSAESGVGRGSGEIQIWRPSDSVL